MEKVHSVVLTGASTGIGAACAQYLDEKGFRVFATVRKKADAERVATLGSDRLEPLFLDVREAESIAEAARKVETSLGGGGLAGLVNNAGVSVDIPMECVDCANSLGTPPADDIRRAPETVTPSPPPHSHQPTRATVFPRRLSASLRASFPFDLWQADLILIPLSSAHPN